MIMSWIAAAACSVTMEVTSWRLGIKVAVRTSSCSACPSSFCQRALPCRVSAACRSGSEVLARLNIKLHALPATPHFSSILRCLCGASACNVVWLHRQGAAQFPSNCGLHALCLAAPIAKSPSSRRCLNINSMAPDIRCSNIARSVIQLDRRIRCISCAEWDARVWRRQCLSL